jgi:DNA-binding LytR/AlgR family response regulator
MNGQQQSINTQLIVVRSSMYFISGGRRMKVPLERITHFSATISGTVIHTVGRRYDTVYQVADICGQLPQDQFFRVHPMHIVALRHVRGLEGKELMVGDHRLFTTHYYRRLLIEAMDRRRIIPAFGYRRKDRLY